MNIPRRNPRFWLSCLLGVVLVMVIFIIARDSKATWFFATVGKIPYFDKVGHFFIMGLISLCAVAGLAHRLRTLTGLHSFANVFIRRSDRQHSWHHFPGAHWPPDQSAEGLDFRRERKKPSIMPQSNAERPVPTI